MNPRKYVAGTLTMAEPRRPCNSTSKVPPSASLSRSSVVRCMATSSASRHERLLQVTTRRSIRVVSSCLPALYASVKKAHSPRLALIYSWMMARAFGASAARSMSSGLSADRESSLRVSGNMTRRKYEWPSNPCLITGPITLVILVLRLYSVLVWLATASRSFGSTPLGMPSMVAQPESAMRGTMQVNAAHSMAGLLCWVTISGWGDSVLVSRKLWGVRS